MDTVVTIDCLEILFGVIGGFQSFIFGGIALLLSARQSFKKELDLMSNFYSTESNVSGQTLFKGRDKISTTGPNLNA
jgi:hypothetical protein